MWILWNYLPRWGVESVKQFWGVKCFFTFFQFEHIMFDIIICHAWSVDRHTGWNSRAVSSRRRKISFCFSPFRLHWVSCTRMNRRGNSPQICTQNIATCLLSNLLIRKYITFLRRNVLKLYLYICYCSLEMPLYIAPLFSLWSSQSVFSSIHLSRHSTRLLVLSVIYLQICEQDPLNFTCR